MSDQQPPFVRPDVAQFLAFLNAQAGPRMHEVGAPDARLMMATMVALAELPIGSIARDSRHDIPTAHGAVPVRVFDAKAERPAGPVMLFFHGGGFVIGNTDIYASYCAEAARQLDMPVISVDYRLSPEHPFPASTDDCEAVARAIAADSGQLDLNATGLVLSGDSAGGNLTIVTAMALRDQPAELPVIAQHPIYPVVSQRADWPSMEQFSEGHLLTAADMLWFGECYAPDAADWRAAPLEANHAGMPPSLVTTASLDPLHDQGVAYVEALRLAGVEVEHREAMGTIHGHITLRQAIPSAVDDMRGNLAALRAMIDRQPT